LNHGEKIKAVGSSDTHYVDSAVGQGRTYLRSSTDEPTKIKVDEAVASFLKGQSSISLGIFSEVFVEKKFGPGQIVPVSKDKFQVRLRVAAPSWITPQRALVFINGVKVAEQLVETKPGKATDTWLDFTLPAPAHDAHLVCAVFGDGVHEPCWPVEENYTLAGTNPVFLDADGDGTYKSPRASASTLLAHAGNNADKQWEVLSRVDDGIASQMLDLIYEAADPQVKQAWNDRLQKASSERPLFREFLDSIRATKT
jgi:hypothetical protein